MNQARLITQKYIQDFFQIDEKEAAELYPKLERIVYKNGEDIVHIGDDSDGMYFLDDGKAYVLNADGDVVNEMQEGHYFGEYAILSGDKRMSTVQAHGKVIAYKVTTETFMEVIGKHPQIVGKMLKQVYGQLSQKHTKILQMSQRHRGLLRDTQKKNAGRLGTLITYLIVAVIFAAVWFLAPDASEMTLPWILIPLTFLVVFTLVTKRTFEGLVLTVALSAGMASGGNFVTGFGASLIEGIGNPGMAETAILMGLIASMMALLSAAGATTALKRFAERRIKSRKGSLLAMFAILFAVFIDEGLNVMTAAFSLQKTQDRQRIPREVPALMCSSATAFCSLIPLSVWGFYFSGTILLSRPTDGESIFLRSIPFNLAGILATIMCILIAFGILPRTKQLKAAWNRVQDGGSIFPVGSEKYQTSDSDEEIYGHPLNLFLPLLVMILSSVAFGMIENHGAFGVDAVAGIIVTMIFMFASYVSQGLMTPGEYMKHLAEGLESAIIPILLLALGDCFAVSLETMHFAEILDNSIPTLSAHVSGLIPMVMLLLFTLLTMVVGDSWAMYSIAIPIALHLSAILGINPSLCAGAVCSAGIIGCNLKPYLEDDSPVVQFIGCGPRAFRKLRTPYWTAILMIASVGYLILGYLF